jgi:hypothetical protein
LSALNLVIPQVLFLIPLTRFPGFIWLIAAGFILPASSVGSQPMEQLRAMRREWPRKAAPRGGV